MVHHDTTAPDKTSDGIPRANTTCHTHTSHGMECHDMAWHETPRKWRERLPMILAPLARACTGVRNPRARPTRPSQTYFCATTTSALKVLSRWSKASRRDMRCVFLEYTHIFSRHCQGSACDTHSSWFQTVCEKYTFSCEHHVTCGMKATRVLCSIS